MKLQLPIYHRGYISSLPLRRCCEKKKENENDGGIAWKKVHKKRAYRTRCGLPGVDLITD